MRAAGHRLLRWVATASLAVAATSAAAELKLMVATDPSGSRELLTARYHDIAISLQAVLGQPVRVERSTVFAEVLRSTRTAEFDIYIVPPHVAASALAHKYELVGVTGKPETFVLVARPGIGSVAQLAQRKIHLAQQDSLYAYMAKGLLNESGGSLTAAKEVRYERTSGAGLVAVQLGLFDATVTRKAEYDEWIKTQNGNKAEVLIESKPVPGGLTLVVNKSMPENLRQKLTAWAAGNAPMDLGLGRMQATSDKAMYQYVGGLGHFTPLQLPGVTRVTAQQAAELMRQGAQMVDVRSEKEFNARRIPGAVLASYIEKSAKDTTFNASLDDFSAVDALDKNRPVIFACNGAECWKSYKASKTAVARGFKTVYWLRGGLPEWEELNFQTARN